MVRSGIVMLLLALTSVARADVVDRVAARHEGTQRVTLRGRGVITDATHPQRPGDFRSDEVELDAVMDAQRGDAKIDISSGAGDERETVRYRLRRASPFFVNEKNESSEAESIGDLSPATVAALQPLMVVHAMTHRRENLVVSKRSVTLAWNDVLWSVFVDDAGRIERLQRNFHHNVHGDRSEVVSYTYAKDARDALASRTVVTQSGREVAHIDWNVESGGEPVVLPAESGQESERLIAAEDVRLRAIAPHIFTIDFDQLDSRVVVAEFSDHLAVLEGAFSSRNCDLIAAALQREFKKPIRYFSFSHLHGQYVAGTRSYVHAGATVIVPSTTVPLIRDIVAQRRTLDPDALSREPRPLNVQTVKDSLTLSDDTNALTIYNVASGHTDEYLIFYFPRQKVVVTGDLFCYRGPDVKLRPRSVQLCETLKKLGLEVETLLPSWPLHGFGCRNVVTREELTGACAPSVP